MTEHEFIPCPNNNIENERKEGYLYSCTNNPELLADINKPPKSSLKLGILDGISGKIEARPTPIFSYKFSCFPPSPTIKPVPIPRFPRNDELLFTRNDLNKQKRCFLEHIFGNPQCVVKEISALARFHSLQNLITVDPNKIYKWGEKYSGIYGDLQDYKIMLDVFLENQLLFEDNQFPPNKSCLGFQESTLTTDINQWLRPKEICESPELFGDHFEERFIYNNNKLFNNTWLVTCLQSLTKYKDLLEKIIPFDQGFNETYAGIFHFRFWYDGRWIDVVIDDKLPAKDQLIQVPRSEHCNEYWMCLVIKAFAKLRGCYEAGKTVSIKNALDNLTDGITMEYFIEDGNAEIIIEAIRQGIINSCFVCAGICLGEDEKSNKAKTKSSLYKGYIYYITRYLETYRPTSNVPLKLLLLKNPHNDILFTGPWNKDDEQWNQFPAEDLETMNAITKPGEFWMDIYDFLKEFSMVDITYMKTDYVPTNQSGKIKWGFTSFEGEWKNKITSGGCINNETFVNNPQYLIRIPVEESKVTKLYPIVISLLQKNRRKIRPVNVCNNVIGFVVIKIDHFKAATKPLTLDYLRSSKMKILKSKYSNCKEINAKFHLPCGFYCLIPTTYEPNIDAEYLLRVHCETTIIITPYDNMIGIVKPPLVFSGPEPVCAEEKESIICNSDSLLKEKFDDYGSLDYNCAKDNCLRLNPAKATDTGHGQKRLPKKRKKEPFNDETVDKHVLRIFFHNVGADEMLDWANLQKLLIENIPQVKKYEPFDKDVCRSLIALYDKHLSGKINYKSFSFLFEDVKHWTRVFSFFDKTCNNILQGTDLRMALYYAGLQVDWQLLNQIGCRFTDANRCMNCNDFLICTIRLHGMIKKFQKRKSDKEHGTFTYDMFMNQTIYA